MHFEYFHGIIGEMELSAVRTTDIILMSGLVGIVILLLVTMAVHRNRQMKAAASRRPRGTGDSERLLPPGIRLSALEEQVLSRIGWLFRNPGRAHRILTDSGLFLQAARRALREGLATERELLGLARKAGFSFDRISPDAMSTLKIPAGVEVSVADGSMKSGAGSIVTNHPDALRVRLKIGNTHFRIGTRLDVVCNSSRGLYRFSSLVVGANGKTLDLSHTDEIESVQRRKHERHGVQLPAEIRTGNGSSLQTKTSDVSIGGAAVRNPNRTFTAGDRVTVAIEHDSKRITIPAIAVRVSRGGRILHLQFERPSESVRHRLFRMIMAASQARRGRRG